jgi:hypothetical protein
LGQTLAATVTDANGRFTFPGVKGHLSAEFMLPGFTTQRVEFDAGTDLRVNLQLGGQEETVTVNAEKAAKVRPRSPTRVGGNLGAGAGGGKAGGVVAGIVGAMPSAPSPAYLANAIGPMEQATTRDLGDLFEYKLKNLVSIPRNRSAMVPIVSSPVGVERVSTWSSTDRGRRPHRALWLTNTSGLTLDGGSVTVLDHESFAGEGLIETLKAGERRLLSYAVDLGMQVQAAPAGLPGSAQRIRIARGVVSVDTVECDQTQYTARNDDTTARQLVIEHPRREGWKLVDGKPAPDETSTTAWRFLVPVAPKASATLTVVAYRPVQSTMSLSSLDDDQIALYVKNTGLDDASRRALAAILDRKRKIADLNAALEARNNEAQSITDDQERIRKNMQSLKGSSEEKQLVQRYVTQLNDQEDRLKVLADEQKALERQVAEAATALEQQIQSLTVGSDASAAQPCAP